MSISVSILKIDTHIYLFRIYPYLLWPVRIYFVPYLSVSIRIYFCNFATCHLPAHGKAPVLVSFASVWS